MLTVLVALKLWGLDLHGKKVVIFCDNLAVCIVINIGKARISFLQHCLGEICFIASVHEFQLKATHHAGTDNRIADCLSK
jgi:hypothetical protein